MPDDTKEGMLQKDNTFGQGVLLKQSEAKDVKKARSSKNENLAIDYVENIFKFPGSYNF